MTPALFPELDEDRAAFDGSPLPVRDDDPDRGLDRGPDRLLQRRLPGAGFVRLMENPTPLLGLPRQACRTIICEWCGCDTDEWRSVPSAWRASTLRVCPRCARRRR